MRRASSRSLPSSDASIARYPPEWDTAVGVPSPRRLRVIRLCVRSSIAVSQYADDSWYGLPVKVRVTPVRGSVTTYVVTALSWPP